MKRARLLLLLGAALLLVPVSSQAIEPAEETFEFPSASSTVDSGGISDPEEIGGFYSVSAGHSVSETFLSSLASIDSATLNLNIPTNVLSNGNQVDWAISINGNDVGTFVVVQGETGPKTVAVTFPAIAGPSYVVKIRVTNEVPGGFGSHNLTYAGSDPHSLVLRGLRPNTCDDTSNPDVDEDGLLSEPIHNGVEPLVPLLTPTVHRVNCQVVVPLGL